jgi:hypothetical protein
MVKMSTTKLLATLAVLFGLVFIILGGGIALLVTLFGSAVAFISVPVLWFSGRRRNAARLLAGWGIYLACYVAVSTALALLPLVLRTPHPKAVGQEVCADSGCFAVDKVDRTTEGPETAVTLSWHLASNDNQQPKHFPGKGLELYMFDERGRTFRLPDSADQNPLDVMLPPGETVRHSMTFRVPGDARELFLTAKYRPFTFQSLLPGELSLVPHRDAEMIRIQ